MTLLRTAPDARTPGRPASALLGCPPSFDGELERLAAEYIIPNLPTREAVASFHESLTEYVAELDPLLLLRAVTGTERGQVYQGEDGSRFRATDNAPAWWVHAALTHGHRIAPGAVSDVIATMPTHMFEIASTSAPTANASGWHIAHIFPVKDGDTDYRRWRRRGMVGRFVRNIHPCNYFLVPKCDWMRWGGDPRVIGFFAALYQNRYSSVWQEFVSLAGAAETALMRVTGPVSYKYSFGAAGRSAVGRSARSPSRLPATAPLRREGTTHVAEYRSSRLTFKRDVIEQLGDDDVFRVITREGVFEMTKSEFYRIFPRVSQSRSYRDAGSYNYPTIPDAAEQFRVVLGVKR